MWKFSYLNKNESKNGEVGWKRNLKYTTTILILKKCSHFSNVLTFKSNYVVFSWKRCPMRSSLKVTYCLGWLPTPGLLLWLIVCAEEVLRLQGRLSGHSSFTSKGLTCRLSFNREMFQSVLASLARCQDSCPWIPPQKKKNKRGPLNLFEPVCPVFAALLHAAPVAGRHRGETQQRPLLHWICWYVWTDSSRYFFRAVFCTLSRCLLVLPPTRGGAHLPGPSHNPTCRGAVWRREGTGRLLPLSAPTLPHAHLWAGPFHCSGTSSCCQHKQWHSNLPFSPSPRGGGDY